MVYIFLLAFSSILCALAPQSTLEPLIEERWCVSDKNGGQIVCRLIPLRAPKSSLSWELLFFPKDQELLSPLRRFFVKRSILNRLGQLPYFVEEEDKLIRFLQNRPYQFEVISAGSSITVLNNQTVLKLRYTPPRETYFKYKSQLEVMGLSPKTKFYRLQRNLSVQKGCYMHAIFCVETMPYLGESLFFTLKEPVKREYLKANFHRIFANSLGVLLPLYEAKMLHGDICRGNLIAQFEDNKVFPIDWEELILMSKTTAPYQKLAIEMLRLALSLGEGTLCFTFDEEVKQVYEAAYRNSYPVPEPVRRFHASIAKDKELDVNNITVTKGEFLKFNTETIHWFFQDKTNLSSSWTVKEIYGLTREGLTSEEKVVLFVQGAVKDPDLMEYSESQQKIILILRFLLSYILANPKDDKNGEILFQVIKDLIQHPEPDYIPTLPYRIYGQRGWIFPPCLSQCA